MKLYFCPLGFCLFSAVIPAGNALGAGPLERLPNTTLQMPAQPAVFGFMVTNAFEEVTFTDPIAIASPPGETNRLFIAEQAGRVAVITNLAAPNRTTFLDLSSRVVADLPGGERGLLGLAFHPGYATNRQFYVFYTGNATNQSGNFTLHDILARYEASPSNPNVALTNEVRLIAQFDQANNHNGGDLHFGPDGYLYVSTGDEGGQNDNLNNSQMITNDFFSALLRIDVDNRPGNLTPNPHPASLGPYSIPADNPYVGATQFNGTAINPATVRTEFWAVGFRNPWRFSFDPITGHLYCGDVGQNAFEEIDIVTRGGNYGWAYREGLVSGFKSNSTPAGFTHINPILAYGRGTGTNQGYVVIGGVVYRGQRFSQLAGLYVFADNASGNIWTLRYDGTNASGFRRIEGESGISAFGVDPRNGDVLIANQTSDRIRRLVYSTSSTGTPLPPTLAATGAFTNLATLSPAAGVVPYEVNLPFWSDNGIKTRWFSVPNTNLTIGFAREANWSFPTGAVWIKHFELERTNGVPASRQRLETRLLVKNSAGIYGATYRWTTPPTNALLVAEEGLDEPLLIHDAGTVRTQIWRYPSRAECSLCHTPAGGYALGFNSAQLNRDHDYGGAFTNQIAALNLAGYFNTNVTGIDTLPALAHPTNAAASLELRARSYLAANCAQCHQPGGLAPGFWDGRFSTPTAAAGLVNGPLVNYHGDPNNRVIKPGSLSESMLLTRIATLGPGRMPPLGSTLLDAQAIALFSAWITNDWPSGPCLNVLNAGFEDGFSLAGGGYIANHWTEWEASPGVVIGYDETALKRSGGHAHRIRVWGGPAGTSGGVYQRVPAASGQSFSISAWVYAEAGVAACALGVDPAGGTNAGGVVWSPPSTNATWVQQTVSGNAAADFITVFLKVTSFDDGKRNGYFDDLTPSPATDQPQLLAGRNGNQLILTWPECPAAILETAGSLSAPMTWSPATNHVRTVGGQRTATITPNGSAGFYRLLRQ